MSKFQQRTAAIAAFTASAALAILPAFAGEKYARFAISEREPNDLQAQAFTLSGNQIASIPGSLSNSKDVDLYSWTLNPGAAFPALVFRNIVNDRVRTEIYEDTNKNRQLDASDRRKFVNSGFESAIPELEKQFLIKIHLDFGGTSTKYTMEAIANSFDRTVTVSVPAAKALTRFDTKIPFTDSHEADFSVTPTVNGQVLPKSNKVADNDAPRFNYKAEAKVPSGVQKIPIKLKLVDDDPDFPETANINPIAGRQVLDMSYDPLTGQILSSDGKVLGTRGQSITIQGNDSQKQASITFTVEHQDPF